MTPNVAIVGAKAAVMGAALLLLSGHALDAGTYHLSPVGGTIRSTTPGEWFVVDAGHAHTGIGAIRCQDDGVLIVRVVPYGDRDGWGTVTPDNVMASRDITPGLSISPGGWRVGLYRHGDFIRCDDPLVSGGGTNLWLQGQQVTR